VVEYDQPLQWVELRGQVVGKTVSSLSYAPKLCPTMVNK
jgi:hypothetical protein